MNKYLKAIIALAVIALSGIIVGQINVPFPRLILRCAYAWQNFPERWVGCLQSLSLLTAFVSFVVVPLDVVLNIVPEMKTLGPHKQLSDTKLKWFRRVQWLPVVLLTGTIAYIVVVMKGVWRLTDDAESLLVYIDLAALLLFSLLVIIVSELFTSRSWLLSAINAITTCLILATILQGILFYKYGIDIDGIIALIVIISTFLATPVVWLINMLHQLLPAPGTWRCSLKFHRYFCYYYIIVMILYVVPLFTNFMHNIWN